MFGGLMSRCMKPALCTTSSPSRSGAASAATCASASGRRTPTQSGSGAPSTNSITMYAVPFASKKRITRTMFGWRNEARVRDSSRKRRLPQSKISALSSERGAIVGPELRHLGAAGVGDFGGVEAALGNLLGGVRKPRDRLDDEKREHHVQGHEQHGEHRRERAHEGDEGAVGIADRQVHRHRDNLRADD